MGIFSYFRKRREERERREAERVRDEKLNKIRKFQKAYDISRELLGDSYSYTLIPDVELRAKSSEELDGILEVCEQGQRHIDGVVQEATYRKEAEGKYFTFEIRIPAPGGSCWLEYSQPAGKLGERERHCLMLLKILRQYRFIDDREWLGGSAVLLGRPVKRFSDSGRSSRGYQTAIEIRDEEYLGYISFMQEPPEYAFNIVRNAMRAALKRNPSNATLARLQKEFKAKGVLNA